MKIKKETLKRILDIAIMVIMVATIITAFGILSFKAIRDVKKPSYHIETIQDSYGVYTILTDNKGKTLHVRYDQYFNLEPSEGVENESN